MQQTRKALLDHLNSANLSAETIKTYAAEFARGDSRRVVRLSVDLPAIFIVFDLGQPIADVPNNTMSLLFVHDSKTLEREENEKDCLEFAAEYMDWLYENYRFKDNERWYSLVNFQDTVLEALLYDQKYTVLGCQLTISVEK